MSPHKLRLVARLCRDDSKRITTHEIREAGAEELSSLGVFQRAEPKDKWPVDNEIGYVPVYEETDGSFYYFFGGRQSLTRDDVQLWSINRFRLAEIVGQGFGCPQGTTEVVAGRMWDLGPSGFAIGRSAVRNVFFIDHIASRDDEPVKQLQKAGRSYVAIVGWPPDEPCLDKDTAKRIFPIDQAMEISEDGVWTVRSERINANFDPICRPSVSKRNPEWLKKTDRIARFFMRLCFQFRHDYQGLERERKRLATAQAIKDELGMTKNDIGRSIGDAAIAAGTNDPVATFWHRTFTDNDLYLHFDQWVTDTNVAKKQQCTPAQLKDELERAALQRTRRNAR